MRVFAPRCSVETDVFEVERLSIDATDGWRDPVCRFAGFDYPASHERLHEGFIRGTRQPGGLVSFPCFFGQDFAFGANVPSAEVADGPVESLMRQPEAEGNSGLLNDAIPAFHARLDLEVLSLRKK
jgi:hypothetical protein